MFTTRLLDIYGSRVSIECEVPPMQLQADLMLGLFRETLPAPAAGTEPPPLRTCRGRILRFDRLSLLRRITAQAKRVGQTTDFAEIYRDDERVWIVDERWGVSEIDVLRGQWTSWVLPDPKIDPLHCFEQTYLWPMSQLLAPRGLHLIPAASIEKDGIGRLILSPYGLEQELFAFRRDGYRIIGQRWTAVRRQGDSLYLMHMPGRLERTPSRRLRRDYSNRADWRDLAPTGSVASRRRAVCQIVLAVEHSRRLRGRLRELTETQGAELLRRVWPGHLPGVPRATRRLLNFTAAHARCCQVQLSRNPAELIALLMSIKPNLPLTGVLEARSSRQPRVEGPVRTTIFKSGGIGRAVSLAGA